MKTSLTTELTRLANERRTTGVGPFQKFLEEEGIRASDLTNAEIKNYLMAAYSKEVLKALDDASLSQFYGIDLEAALGERRAAAALKSIKSFR